MASKTPNNFEEAVKQALIDNTLGISTYDKRMENIIIRLDEAVKAISTLCEEEKTKAYKKGYVQCGIDQILAHDKAIEVVKELNK